jgi:hypothetical protein
VLPGQPGEDRIGEGRRGPCWRRHPRMMTVRPVSGSPGSAHGQPSLSLQVSQAGPMNCGLFQQFYRNGDRLTSSRTCGPAPCRG